MEQLQTIRMDNSYATYNDVNLTWISRIRSVIVSMNHPDYCYIRNGNIQQLKCKSCFISTIQELIKVSSNGNLNIKFCHFYDSKGSPIEPVNQEWINKVIDYSLCNFDKYFNIKIG